jgi:hypothetical protein
LEPASILQIPCPLKINFLCTKINTYFRHALIIKLLVWANIQNDENQMYSPDVLRDECSKRFPLQNKKH